MKLNGSILVAVAQKEFDRYDIRTMETEQLIVFIVKLRKPHSGSFYFRIFLARQTGHQPAFANQSVAAVHVVEISELVTSPDLFSEFRF